MYRRTLWTAALAAMLLATAFAPRVAVAGTTGPRVNLAALGSSSLAFVWHHRLYLATGRAYPSGGRPGVRAVTSNGTALNPIWSPDERWLLYTYTAPGRHHTSQAWVVRVDDRDAHRVTGGVWAPRGHTLTSFSGNTIVLNPIDALARRYHVPFTVVSVSWTADDTRMLLAGRTPGDTSRRDVLYSLSLTTHALRRIGQMPRVRVTTPPPGPVWWPNGRGYVYAPDPYGSASIAADGLHLYSATLAGGQPHLLGTALWGGMFSPNGRRFLFVRGAGRGVYANKRLAVCTLPATCRTIDARPGTVSLDPAWSPDGREIAFVRARSMPGGFGFTSDAAMLRQIETQTLWISRADGTGSHDLTHAGTGVYNPRWSTSGDRIVYVRNNTVWTISTTGSAAAQPIVRLLPGSLFPQYPGPLGNLSYYGHVSWNALFAWTADLSSLPLA
jgi:Tol biopolymer transport system component